MIEYYYDIEQGSIDWINLRKGRMTASEVHKIVTPAKLKISDGAGARTLQYQLASQIATDNIEEHYITESMQRGKDDEIVARYYYDKDIALVKQCGFMTNDKLGFIVGYSPDGLVGDDGLIEIKSKHQGLQFETIVDSEEVPVEHRIQLQTALIVSERKWIDFVSYSNGMPLYIKRVFEDKEVQEAIIKGLIASNEIINKLVETYKEKSRGLILTKRIEVNHGEIN